MIQTTLLTVTGMKCGGCENNITDKLTALEGVVKVNANYKKNHVSIEYESEKINIDDLEEGIITAGFAVE